MKGGMTNKEWLDSLTKEQMAALLTSGNIAKLNARARLVWLGTKHAKEDEVFTFDKKKVTK